MITGIVVLPKEGNVADFVEQNFDLGGLSAMVRVTKAWSEDVPAIVESLEGAIGFTGMDYWVNSRLSNSATPLRVVKVYPWRNPEYLFGYPALCILGPKDDELDKLPQQLRICINSKWKCIVERYLAKELEAKGWRITQRLLIRGETEERFKEGIVDLVAEVYCRGNGADSAGLKVYRKIFTNKGVVAIAKVRK